MENGGYKMRSMLDLFRGVFDVVVTLIFGELIFVKDQKVIPCYLLQRRNK